MNFNSVFSAGKAPDTPEQVQELLKNIIIITNYLPGIRSSIGWRGIFRIPYDNECWTFKISGFDGVFGLNYSCSNENGSSLSSSFDLYYFPAPDEDLIEKFSINGGGLAYTESYKQLIREFPEHPEFSCYYNIGKLNIIYNPNGSGIEIAIESMSEEIIISVNGIKSGNGSAEFIVEPGEPEQAIPSYLLSSVVFDLLVSSLSYHLGNGPSALRLICYPGQKGFFGDGVLRTETENSGVTLNSLATIFTDSNETIEKFMQSETDGREIEVIRWSGQRSGIPQAFSDFKFLNSGGQVNSNSLNRALLGIEIKPPPYIVSGFLGAGKTSFIKNFLEFQAQKYLFGAVIQNELGETGLDGKLIEDECRVVEMDEGCVCCSLSGNLRKGINSVITEFVPDFILLETTGAANPMNLISEIHDLGDIIKFDSVTTIVDSENICESLKNYDIAKDQIKAADIIVLNKTDCLDSQQIDNIKETVMSINSRAVIEQAEFGRINPSLLYDSEVNISVNNHASHFAVHNHSTHSGEGLTSITINLPDSIRDSAFIEKIKNLPFDIFRIKGLIKFNGYIDLFLFQYVSKRYDISAYTQNAVSPFLVLIGRDLDTPAVLEYFRF